MVAGQLAVALAAAYGLTRWRGRARSSVLLLYCLLPLLPSQVMLLPNYLICRALGLLNTQLAVVLLGVFSPLSVFLLDRAMGRVGPEQAQAAALDGAGEWTLLRHIYLPQVRETALIAAALAFLAPVEHGGAPAGAAVGRGEAAPVPPAGPHGLPPPPVPARRCICCPFS